MNKLKNFIREVFNRKRIDMCLEVFTIFILVPIGILTILVSLIAAMVLSIDLVKTIVGIIYLRVSTWCNTIVNLYNLLKST